MYNFSNSTTGKNPGCWNSGIVLTLGEQGGIGVEIRRQLYGMLIVFISWPEKCLTSVHTLCDNFCLLIKISSEKLITHKSGFKN